MSGCNDERMAFIARIWLEPGLDKPWRGHIRYVQGDQETYFHDLEGMVTFLESISGISVPVRPSTGKDEQKLEG